MRKKIFLVLLSLALGISLAPGEVLGAEYPTREIEFIVGFAFPPARVRLLHGEDTRKPLLYPRLLQGRS